MKFIRNERGTMLLDICIAMMMIGILIGPLAQLWMVGEQTKIYNRNKMIAIDLAQQKMEYMKAIEEQTVQNESGVEETLYGRFLYRIDVKHTDWEGLQFVQVCVWPEDNNGQSVGLVTLRRAKCDETETSG